MSRFSPILRLVRVVTATSRKNKELPKCYNLQVSCRVKPNASGDREGIIAVGAEKVDVCCAAVPRNGEANAAVSRVFAQVFNVAKSDVGVVHGLKSRDKVLCIADMNIGTQSEEEFLQTARQQLEDAITKK
ncbi:YggU family protein [Aspergillus cavernicola]|uniref:YggU family protein n=1 Tax=Aspergillus cavernicola TaxID=176166 RepID=A0ABR4ID21_9EURO